jgi:hypothetical protein
MNLSKINIAIVAFVLIIEKTFSQGFVNLNFEDATVVPVDPPLGNTVFANSAVPGWASYYISNGSTNQTPIVFYNSYSAGGAFIGLNDTSNTFPSLSPLAGSYSVLLQGSGFGTPTTAAIGQTGQISANARSLLFYQQLTVYGLRASFNGLDIPLIQIGTTSRYAIMGGDISAFAGQTGQLLFSALPNQGNALLDNIQFSTSSIPEPGTLALAALGGGLLGFRRWHRNSQR